MIYKQKQKENTSVFLQKGALSLTIFGRNFVRVCV